MEMKLRKQSDVTRNKKWRKLQGVGLLRKIGPQNEPGIALRGRSNNNFNRAYDLEVEDH